MCSLNELDQDNLYINTGCTYDTEQIWTNTLAQLDPIHFIGTYQRLLVENPWHEVEVNLNGEELNWTNSAGVSWLLQWTSGYLKTGIESLWCTNTSIPPKT